MAGCRLALVGRKPELELAQASPPAMARVLLPAPQEELPDLPPPAQLGQSPETERSLRIGDGSAIRTSHPSPTQLILLPQEQVACPSWQAGVVRSRIAGN